MPTTPTNRKPITNLDISKISPTQFQRSPRTPNVSSPQAPSIQPRLTAIVRRILENYSTWMVGHDKGSRICSNLENIKLKLLDKATEDQGASVFSDELSTWHKRLELIIAVFVDIVKNAADTVTQLRALEQLQKDNKDRVIYRTWTIRRFVSVAEELLIQYENELKVKQLVFREMCHRSNRAELIVCTTAWTYPKHVSSETRFIMKCLTAECGLPDLEMEDKNKTGS